ncbi:UNVERIFIED_CONTAM: rod shape-determining protein RodA, partial [Bacteroidetes bacterium 56_B9]
MSSYLDYKPDQAPAGWRKILYLNWPLALLLAAVASAGFLMLYSVAGGRLETWAEPQMERFAVGFVAMIAL